MKDTAAAHWAPDLWPVPVAPEVSARLGAVTSRWADGLPGDVVAGLRACASVVEPGDVAAARQTFSTLCRFVAETGVKDGQALGEVVTHPAIALWVSQYRAHRLSWKSIETIRPRLERVADVLAGVTNVRVARKGGPQLAALPPGHIELLVAATHNHPLHRACLAMLLGAGITATQHPVRVARHDDGWAAIDHLGNPHRILARFAALLSVEITVSAHRWAQFAAFQARVGIDAGEFFRRARRSYYLEALNTLSFLEVRLSRRLSERAMEGAIHALTPCEDIHARIELLRDGVGPLVTWRSQPVVAPRFTMEATVEPERDPVPATPPRSRNARARARKEAAQRFENPQLPEHLEAALRDYMPLTVVPETWAAIKPVFLLAMRRSTIKTTDSLNKYRAPVVSFLAYLHEQGQTVTIETAFTEAQILAFLRNAPGRLAPTSINEYGSRLRSIAASANPGPGAIPRTPVGEHQPVRPPFTPVEEAVIRRVALSQGNPKLRAAICGAVGSTGGAGMTPGEFTLSRARDWDDRGEAGIVAHIKGRNARTVMVRREYEPLIREALRGRRPGDLLSGRKEGGTNPIGDLIARGDFFDDCPRFDGQLLRNTWLAWLICQHLPFRALLDFSGLQSARTFVDLVKYLEPPEVAPDVLQDGTP